MKSSRNLRLSLEILGAHKLRTLLSTAGVMVGIAAVVIMVAAGRGAEEAVMARIQAMGTNLLVVTPGLARPTAGRQPQASSVSTLVPEDVPAIAAACPSVALAAGARSGRYTVRWEAATANTLVVGLEPQGFGIRNVALAAGRVHTDAEERGRTRVAVLGRTVADNLFGSGEAVGRTVRIGRAPFEVIGVVEPKGMDQNGQDQDDVIYVPLLTAMRRLMNVTHLDAVYLQARDQEALASAEREVRDLLRERHRLRNGAGDDFTIQNQASLLETERATGAAMTRLVGSVAAISLVVGGVGILAVMLISIRERRREIGLRRALGATRKEIGEQFLTEALLLTGAGSLAGLTLGLAGALLVGALGRWEMAVSWTSVILALGTAVLVGVTFGFYPAAAAARLEPVDALRAE